jgi:hypothetical protein
VSLLLGGGAGGTVMTSTFFGAEQNGSYQAANSADFTDVGSVAADGGLSRAALPASDVWYGGGGRSGRGLSSWLPEEALEELLREYRARSAPDLRVGEAARGLLRTVVEANAEAALRAAATTKGGPKMSALTAARLSKVAAAMRLAV